jgi:hypothetical protein
MLLFDLIVLNSVLAAQAATVPVPVLIEVEAPVDCAGGAEFYERIAARTHRVRPAAPAEPALRFRVRLREVPGGVRGELYMLGEQGETDRREVDGATCDEVVEALSLTAALAIDPEAGLVAGDAAAAAETGPKDAPRRSTPPAVPAEPPRESAPEESQSFGLELGGELAAGEVVSPFVALGAGVFARLFGKGREGWRPTLGLRLLHLRNDIFTTPVHASVRFTALAVEPCPVRVDANGLFQWEPCAVLAGGFIQARGKSVTNPSSVVRSWWSVGALIRALTLGEPRLQFELGFSAPLVRRRFVLTSPDNVVAETPAVSVLGAFGLSFEP